MCECGCSSGHTILELPAPKNQVYLLEFSSGCDECETPAGVIVTRVGAKDTAREFSSGKLRLHEDGFGRTEVGIGLVYAHEVHKFVLEKLCEALGVKDVYQTEALDCFDPEEFKEQLYEFFAKSVRKGLEPAMPKRKSV